ncbi:hypothetical protein [Sphingobacterium cavernae]|uniref:hypothetical protein n=1 Tax=Sphingobacterium cavernae TaxID=2592657 RepID=UPI00122FD33B|nr:hypothetical protein [Sphingobacterium cavernae]
MENKLVNFNIYRFHLNPIESNSKQLELFTGEKLSRKEIKERKNEFFEKIIVDKLSVGTANNPMTLYDHTGNYFLLKIANPKKTKIVKNFKKSVLEHEPYVYVLINNSNTVQKIAISENIEAFYAVDGTKNLLARVLNKELKAYGLNIEIEKLFDVKDFWSYVQKHQNEIKKIEFEFIKPNLANISKVIPNAFKRLQEKTNAHKAKVTIEAPEHGYLEKISKANKEINGMVEYSSEGGGNIVLKVKGLRKQLNTEEKPVILQIKELDLEGAPEQLIKIYKEIID